MREPLSSNLPRLTTRVESQPFSLLWRLEEFCSVVAVFTGVSFHGIGLKGNQTDIHPF